MLSLYKKEKVLKNFSRICMDAAGCSGGFALGDRVYVTVAPLPGSPLGGLPDLIGGYAAPRGDGEVPSLAGPEAAVEP